MKKRTFMITTLIVIVVIVVLVTATLNHPAFGRLPHGNRLARIEQSGHYRDGQFRNLHTTPELTGNQNLIESAWNYLFRKPPLTSPDSDVATVKTDLKALVGQPGDAVVWLGHSSLLIRQDGLTMLVDPVLTNEFPASLMLTPFKGTMIYSPDDMPHIDVLIITHDHWDHLDYATVKRLRNRVDKVVCPLGVGEHFEFWGYRPEKIVELNWNETTSVANGLNITCLPARHFSGRSFNRNKTLWAGYMIEGSRNIYLSGDGGYDIHFKKIAKQYPIINLAVMENGQYSPNWRYIHLLPFDLRQAISDLRPQMVMTVHNSKFSLAPHRWTEPLDSFNNFATSTGLNCAQPLIGEPVVAGTPTPTRPWWQK